MVEGKRGREWRPSMSLKVTPNGLLSPRRPYLINISKPAKIAPIAGYMYMNRCPISYSKHIRFEISPISYVTFLLQEYPFVRKYYCSPFYFFLTLPIFSIIFKKLPDLVLNSFLLFKAFCSVLSYVYIAWSDSCWVNFCRWHMLRAYLHFFLHVNSHFPVLFVEETVFSPGWPCFPYLVHLIVCTRAYLWSLVNIHAAFGLDISV